MAEKPPYLPLSVRASVQTRNEYDALVEGYPDYLHLAIEDWMWRYADLSNRDPGITHALIREIGVWRRKSSPRSFSSTSNVPFSNLKSAMEGDSDFAVDVLDYLAGHTDQDTRQRLEIILREGGSAYMVDPTGTVGLVHRAPDAAVKALKAALDDRTKAADHLALAWTYLYGRTPNASAAYREAVRAVEVMACPAVLPKSTSAKKATLGAVLGELDKAPGKLKTVFSDAKADGAKRAIEMMRLLWHAQHDRHGDPDPEAPLHVSDDEARGAVHLAVLLVTWWHQGTLREAP